jgi:hypothetical protein
MTTDRRPAHVGADSVLDLTKRVAPAEAPPCASPACDDGNTTLVMGGRSTTYEHSHILKSSLGPRAFSVPTHDDRRLVFDPW